MLLHTLSFGLPGSEVGHVVACCCDETGACLLVEVGNRVEEHSRYSQTYLMRNQTCSVWYMHEATCCAAWRWEGDRVTVVVM